MQSTNQKIDNPLYKPASDTRYRFTPLPKSADEQFAVLIQKELKKSDLAAKAARQLKQKPEVAARLNFRCGLFRAQGIYKILPTLHMHPAKRLSALAQQVLNEFRDGEWDDHFTKEEIQRRTDVLLTIRSLLVMSFQDYPNMDTDLIQEAFREADTVREGVFLGKASVHRVGVDVYYFPDVEQYSA